LFTPETIKGGASRAARFHFFLNKCRIKNFPLKLT